MSPTKNSTRVMRGVTARLASTVMCQTRRPLRARKRPILSMGPGLRVSARLMSDEDLVGDGFARRALEKKLRAAFVLGDQRLEDSQRIADDFRIGGGLGLVLQALQPLHRLRRHFELHAGGGAFAGLHGVGGGAHRLRCDAAEAAAMSVSMSHVLCCPVVLFVLSLSAGLATACVGAGGGMLMGRP